MFPSYPIHINLYNKHVVVIGGGKVAERKILGMIETGALIEIVSPTITDKLQKCVNDNILRWKQKEFEKEDLRGALFIIAATNSRDLNKLIRLSVEPSQLINIADDPEASDYHIPAVVKRGRLTLSISTGGASPIYTKLLRHQFEKILDAPYEDYFEFLYNCRQYILANVKDSAKRKKLLVSITDQSFFESLEREKKFMVLYNNVMSTEKEDQ